MMHQGCCQESQAAAAGNDIRARLQQQDKKKSGKEGALSLLLELIETSSDMEGHLLNHTLLCVPVYVCIRDVSELRQSE